MDANQEKSDSILVYLLENSGNLPNFFDNLFSFFLRNSDFFKQKDLNKKFIDEKFEYYSNKYIEIQNKIIENEHIQQKEKELLENQSKDNIKVKNLSKDEMENLRIAQDPMQVATRDPDTVSINSNISQNTNYSKKVFEEEKGYENKTEPNQGNGGRCKKYVWTQTLADVSMSMLVGVKLRSKDIDIRYSVKRLFVGLKDGPTIIDGELAYSIKPDTVVWTFDKSNVEGTKYLNITFEKVDGINWWDCIIKGDPTIDLSKINAKNPDISHLNEETKSKIERIMYDQNQINTGQPTSQEKLKREKYKEFIDANPQFNFDKVKIKDEDDDFHY